MSPPAFTRQGPRRASVSDGAVDGVALADPAEVEPHARRELDRATVHLDAAAYGCQVALSHKV